MSSLFERLCGMLDDEIERQENVLAVCQAQSEAVKTNDLEFLEAKTASLVALIREAAQAARDRAALMESIVAEQGLNRAGLAFADLAAAAPEPLRRRLDESHRRLRDVLAQTRPIALANASSMRQALRGIRASLALVRPETAAGAAYDATGMLPAEKPRLVNTMDRRG